MTMLRDHLPYVPFCTACRQEIALHAGGMLMCSCEELDTAQDAIQIPICWELDPQDVAWIATLED